MVKTRTLKGFDRVPPMKQSVDTLYLSKKKISNDIIDVIVNETLYWCVKTFGNNPFLYAPEKNYMRGKK